MYFKRIFLSSVICTALFSASSYADIVLQSTDENVCATLPGNWNGEGTISTKIIARTIHCDYTGTAKMSATSTPNVFSADVNLVLKSGICPAGGEFVTTAVCDAATKTIRLQSEDADLVGTLSADGKETNVKGTVNVTVFGKTLVAHVDKMLLHKI